MIKYKKLLYIISIIIALFFGLAYVTNVTTNVDSADVSAFNRYLDIGSRPKISNFEDEINLIRWAQNSVIKSIPTILPLPVNSQHEPPDILFYKSGLCYDRARVLEKLLNWLGFETRRVFLIFSRRDSKNSLLICTQMFFSSRNTHASVEVKTSRGWLLVDVNSTWMSITQGGLLIPIDEIRRRKMEIQNNISTEILESPFCYFRGVYSRSGKMYPPFFPFPDLNWSQFLASFFID